MSLNRKGQKIIRQQSATFSEHANHVTAQTGNKDLAANVANA